MCPFFNVVDVVSIADLMVCLGTYLDWNALQGTWRSYISLTELGDAMMNPHTEDRATTARFLVLLFSACNTKCLSFLSSAIVSSSFCQGQIKTFSSLAVPA